ncbi:unnamed protein product [Arctogadus glacialis]
MGQTDANTLDLRSTEDTEGKEDEDEEHDGHDDKDGEDKVDKKVMEGRKMAEVFVRRTSIHPTTTRPPFPASSVWVSLVVEATEQSV